MPYHALAAGVRCEAMEPALRILVLPLMRAVASGRLAVAILEPVLLFTPAARRDGRSQALGS